MEKLLINCEGWLLLKGLNIGKQHQNYKLMGYSSSTVVAFDHH